MGTNQLTDATKIFILVASVIVVCVLCAFGFKIVNEGKSSVNANTNNIKSMASQYSDIDISLYQDSLVPGSEVTSLIGKAVDNEEYLAIEVKNLSGDYVTYNYYYVDDGDTKTLQREGSLGQEVKTEVPTRKGQYGYINPMAMFKGKTFEDSNGSIVCIYFEQQP